MNIENWNIEELCGYVPKTTFYTDFSIAERFGINAVKDTYKRAFSEWKTNYIYLTELVMALNWKCNRWYGVNDQLSELYYDLWSQADEYAMDNLKDDELSYFLETTD